jgi:F0F1-type ATP synthase beta subunit
MANETQPVVIDGVEYKFDDLSDEQKYFVNQVADIRNQSSQLKFKMDQLTVAEQSFVKLLTDSIKKGKEEPVAE